jgi:hypothetical protein
MATFDLQFLRRASARKAKGSGGLPAGVSRIEREVRLRGATRRLRRTASARNQERRLVTLTFASWNQLDGWLRRVEELRRAA